MRVLLHCYPESRCIKRPQSFFLQPFFLAGSGSSRSTLFSSCLKRPIFPPRKYAIIFATGSRYGAALPVRLTRHIWGYILPHPLQHFCCIRISGVLPRVTATRCYRPECSVACGTLSSGNAPSYILNICPKGPHKRQICLSYSVTSAGQIYTPR
ncbi:hypothetical protein SAMN04487894_12131 [Niabella drilacis]|uniref:Uncharacterized protein n=1 Tax=Niabella drilacis (strain DSM 25811 / CCM 8410 / CCUG 62505 / LMG 26954 / E90) TaxID=1285928 RepID=A0A1G7A6K7_NIADE|nr:hypothetical protein SAMN04487894_12131 [Niabella drilacis]